MQGDTFYSLDHIIKYTHQDLFGAKSNLLWPVCLRLLLLTSTLVQQEHPCPIPLSLSLSLSLALTMSDTAVFSQSYQPHRVEEAIPRDVDCDIFAKIMSGEVPGVKGHPAGPPLPTCRKFLGAAWTSMDSLSP